MIQYTDKQFKSLIKKFIQIFGEKFAIKPVIGLEIEFYIKNAKDVKLIEQHLLNKNLRYKLTKESGDNQFEIQLAPSTQIIKKIEELNLIKKVILEHQGATFVAKPFSDQPGSALHLHLNFLNSQHQNIFEKTTEQEPILLQHVVAGLLHTLPEAMYFLAPNNDDYDRYIPSIETPSTISWGNNNRTVAIRIPAKESGKRRIEHRVASANSNPFAVCAIIFAGCIYGLQNKLIPTEKIYGNAYLSLYNLEPLPKNLESSYNYLITRKNLLNLMSTDS
jgi:glutamine synthetase